MRSEPAPGIAFEPVPPEAGVIGVVADRVVKAPVLGVVDPIGGGAAKRTCCESVSELGSILTVNPSGGFVSIV